MPGAFLIPTNNEVNIMSSERISYKAIANVGTLPGIGQAGARRSTLFHGMRVLPR